MPLFAHLRGAIWRRLLSKLWLTGVFQIHLAEFFSFLRGEILQGPFPGVFLWKLLRPLIREYLNSPPFCCDWWNARWSCSCYILCLGQVFFPWRINKEANYVQLLLPRLQLFFLLGLKNCLRVSRFFSQSDNSEFILVCPCPPFFCLGGSMKAEEFVSVVVRQLKGNTCSTK